ncbi:MAG TPA: hypothetical protein VGS12_10445 [Caulobacteraceae bacterium]|nr:hypothetical protein [Caulobacteraceae bacterium]
MANASSGYDYVVLELEQGAAAWPALRERMSDIGPLALFAPQIGFKSTDAVLLFDHAPPAAQLPGRVASIDRILPVLRGAPEDLNRDPGIYAHRWFTIRAADRSRFIELSRRAWTTFEQQQGTRVFGLFLAEAASAGNDRLLLLTWYADHGAWQRTRDPPAEARDLFAQRRAITVETVVRTSTLVSG